MAQLSNVIVQGTINLAQGDIHIVHCQHNRDSELGLVTLRSAISLGAIHDSAERSPPPNCHPDTRKAVRETILDWIRSESSLPFFWLYGPAGAGKTAILQAIAEFLCSSSESDESFGGSFFFSRGKSGRDQGHFLFSTIAYQLALKVPGLRQNVNRIMEEKPELHTKSMAVQLQTLIVDSFRCLSPLPQRSYLIIIDGLDECHDKPTQQSILRLLCETITVHKLPLRFLIGSRPESHIRDSLDQQSLYTITRRVVLDETFNPGRDIKVFLQDGFAKICAKSSILSCVKQPWPEDGIIDLLVQRSSGQFIYAATALKFIGADFCSPTKQLALILKHDSTAFSDLDQLYTQILSVYPSTVNIVQVLGIIMAFESDHVSGLTPGIIEDILGMEEGELKLVLRGLSSLVAFKKDGNYLTEVLNARVGSLYKFLHASFEDYLVDSTRSGPFHVNVQEYKNQTTIWSFALITKSIGSSWKTPPTVVPHSKPWRFLESCLPNRYITSPKLVKEAIMTDIYDLVQEFWKISTSGAWVDVFFPAIHCLVEIFKLQPEMRFNCWDLDEKPCLIMDELRNILDQSLKSRDMDDLLKFLPGIVVQNGLTMQGMADLYGVRLDLLECLISAIDPLSPFQNFPHSRYVLEDYVSRFLQDRERSQLYYCDPILHHIFICRHFLSLLDGSHGSNLQSSSYDLPEYVRHNFYDHLCAATEIFLTGQNIPSDHPAAGILNDLENTTYEYVGADLTRHCLAECIIHPILRWADMLNTRLKGAAVPVSNAYLMEQVCRLTDKIYREILCIETDGRMATVTLRRPFRALDKFDNAKFRETLPYRAAIQLSLELLAWKSNIHSSFTEFITTPEKSGPLYICPDVYHTQITEYSLETNFQANHFKPSPFGLGNCFLIQDWRFRDHLSHALPTEMIFHILRSIPSRRLIRDDRAKSMLDLLEIITKWLEGLGSERPSDLYHRFQRELLQCKARPHFWF